MNVKKIVFFTFAFFLPSLFPAVAILTGAILQFFQHSIFAPAPYVFHTPPILKNFISHPLPLSSLHSFIPATLPYRIPNPHPSQSKNNAISLQITTSIYQAKNKSKPQHNKKHSQIDPNHSTCLPKTTQN